MSSRSRLRRFAPAVCAACAALLPIIACVAPGPGGVDDDPFEREPVDLEREIEEADIVKEIDGLLYIVNPFRGLRIIDLSEPERPALVGGQRLGGRGVELFVRDGRAFVFTSNDLRACAGVPLGSAADEFGDVIMPDFETSRMWVVDVSDPAAPELVSRIDLPGFVTATRRVDDVIYVAGNGPRQPDDPNAFDPYRPYYNPREAFVSSIDITAAEDLQLVATETLFGGSLDIHVSPTAIYVVGADPDLYDASIISYVDISDPTGALAVRDQFRVPGRLNGRHDVDERDGILRVITSRYDRGEIVLLSYDVSDPDDIGRAGEVVVAPGAARTVRFDGTRAYVVGYYDGEPLIVIDLADPASPRVGGQVSLPGYSTHIVPLGQRLIGVGYDGSEIRPAVALYDVADARNPRELSRVVVADTNSFGGYSEATVDEKALKVLEDARLILLPFGSYDLGRNRFIDRVQLIDYNADRLTQRGVVEHLGLVRRAGMIDTTLWILSDRAFQSVDASDRNRPQSLHTLELISEQDLLDAGLTQCVGTAENGYYLGYYGYYGYGYGFFPFGCLGAPLVISTLLLISLARTWPRR